MESSEHAGISAPRGHRRGDQASAGRRDSNSGDGEKPEPNRDRLPSRPTDIGHRRRSGTPGEGTRTGPQARTGASPPESSPAPRVRRRGSNGAPSGAQWGVGSRYRTRVSTRDPGPTADTSTSPGHPTFDCAGTSGLDSRTRPGDGVDRRRPAEAVAGKGTPLTRATTPRWGTRRCSPGRCAPGHSREARSAVNRRVRLRWRAATSSRTST